MQIHQRRWLRAITGGLILSLLLSIGALYGQCEGVRENVVRLHILAHSDSTEDQTLKLQVRDAVVAAAGEWPPTVSAAETMSRAENDLSRLQAVAQQTVTAAGYDYPVKVELTRMYFTTRQYDTVTLPAGMYDAVRITIGEGRGQNWWCVVYPPLCLGAAADKTSSADFFNPRQAALLSGGERYILRFKVVEWFETWLRIFERNG